MQNIDYNMKKELITAMSTYYKNEGESMWNFRSKTGDAVLEFCLENYENEPAINEVIKLLSLEAPPMPQEKEYMLNDSMKDEEAFLVASNKFQNDVELFLNKVYISKNKIAEYGINLESIEALNINRFEAGSIGVLYSDLKNKFAGLVNNLLNSTVKNNNSNLIIQQNIEDYFGKNKNLNDEEFSVVFDHILIERYHKQDYSGARDIVFKMSEEDRERFYKKFTSGHSPELLKKHFTDFENVSQKEFKESVFKVTGKVENIPVPPVLYKNNIYQFTNHSFKDKISGETLYLLNDIHNNQFFLEHSFLPDSNSLHRAVRAVDILDSKEFDTSEFLNKYSIKTIGDVMDVAEVLKDLYNPEFNNSKVKELLNSQTLMEKRDAGDVTLKIVLQSHLSDAIIELQSHNPDLVESRLEFCKKLINKYGDLDMGIKDVDLNNLWTKVWESKQKIESSLAEEVNTTVELKPGILTIEKAEANFLEGGWPLNEMLDEKGDLVLRLQEMGYSKDNYVVEFPKTNLVVSYKDLGSAISRFNEIVENYDLQENEIHFNKPEQQNDLEQNSSFDIGIEKQIEFFLDDINPKGEVSNFPKEVLHLMLFNQHKQLGFYDLERFEFDKTSGFEWEKTTQGKNFWENVVIDNNFESFFERYPEQRYSNDHIQNNSLNR